MRNTVLTLTSCGTVLLIILVLIVALGYKFPSKEKFCAPEISQHEPYPQKIKKPAPDPSTICTLPNGQKTKCGYYSRESSKDDEDNEKNGIFSELNLCSKSPVTLDIYHRASDSQKFIFSGTIPTMQSLYVYKDKENNPFRIGDEMFATEHDKTHILYLPVKLQSQKNQIIWGVSSAETDESITIINLISEIGHIKFRNYSYASYKLYYYGEYLGELKPFNKKDGIYFELYVARSSQGFRLGSQVSLVMDGTDLVQNIALTHRPMTTLNIGLATSQPNF